MLVGVLTHYPLLYFMCDLKATQMNVQCSLIREFMIYKFKLSHNTVEAIKNISYTKS